MDFVIAVDGTAASGKGTLAVALAQRYGLPHLDTGLLYRAVGEKLRRTGGDLSDAAAAGKAAATLDLSTLEDPALRTPEAGEAASVVAVHSEVRSALFSLQQSFASRPGGAVLDGRDIGTVIAPWAGAKLFVDASVEVRAKRRWLQAGGEGGDLEAMIQALRLRDARDSGRSAAPLSLAEDAVLLDTSEMSISQAADAARRIVEAARARWLETQKPG